MARTKKTKENELPKEPKVAAPESGNTEPQGNVDPKPEKPESSPKAWIVYNKAGNFAREYSDKSSAENKRNAEGFAAKTGGTARPKE